VTGSLPGVCKLGVERRIPLLRLPAQPFEFLFTLAQIPVDGFAVCKAAARLIGL
jgi:hypothetical protein